MKHLIVFFLLLLTDSYAQELHFENLQLKGLPSTEVYKILQDSEGYIWMATDAGICRYDGNTLTTFTVKDGISENVILKMKEDAKKRIWFSTLSGYFFYYEKGHFTQIAANEELKKKQIYPPADFFIGENDTLFFASREKIGDYIKIPPQLNYKNILVERPKFDNAKRISCYLIKNRICASEVLVGGALLYINKDSTYNLDLSDTVLKISLKYVQGDFHGSNASNGLILTDGTIYLPLKNELICINSRKEISYYNFPGDLCKLYCDKDGDLWVGTKIHGVYLFKNGDLTKTPIHSLPSLSVTSILLDEEETVWVSTLEKGVFQSMNKYVNTLAEKGTNLKIRHRQLNVTFASKKELFVSPNDSILIKDLSSIFPKQVKLRATSKVNQTIYYAFDQGLYSITNNVISEINFLDNTYPVYANYLIELRQDTLLAINGIDISTIVHSVSVNHFRPHFSINFATQLPGNTILLTSRSDVGIFELKNNNTTPFLNHIKELKTRINWITIDSVGNLWIATNEKGLYCYDIKKQLHAFNETNGLISNKVNSCAVSPNGDIWCGTHSGLSKLTSSLGLDKIKIENFNKNHGVVDLEIEKIACFNNKIWCAGKTAFYFFYPEKMKKNTAPPGVYIKSLQIKNHDYSLQDSLFLNHDQNDFRVQYELISYKKTSNRTFFYRLDGFDKSWNISNTGDIQYTNIGYGTYTLTVYGVNNDGVKSDIPQKITFIIKKPFWFTWWFIAIILILIILIIYLSVRYWKNKIEKRENEKTRMNQKIAEFKMTALRSQMNPHFIFNAIGSIQHFILENEAKQSYNYLAKFSLLIRNILNNSREEYITLEQEITTLQLYIDLEQIRFTNPFKFVIDIDETIDIEMEIPTMLIQPYIENSIWHGLMPKESGGILELLFKKEDTSLHIIIRDNGIGRKVKSSSHGSRGMSITQQRIETLEATSQKKFNTYIVDLKDEMNNSIGTEVNIIIPID